MKFMDGCRVILGNFGDVAYVLWCKITMKIFVRYGCNCVVLKPAFNDKADELILHNFDHPYLSANSFPSFFLKFTLFIASWTSFRVSLRSSRAYTLLIYNVNDFALSSVSSYKSHVGATKTRTSKFVALKPFL